MVTPAAPADDTLPQYARIVAHYRDRIESGELPTGERLPSSRDIAEQWNVARQTADKAVAQLHDEGLVEKRDRSRAVVRGRGQRAETTVGIELPPSFGNVAVESSEVIVVDDELSRRLHATAGAPMLVLRLRHSGPQ